MMNNRERLVLAQQAMMMSKITRCSDWDSTGDVGQSDVSKMAKPIPPVRWGKAFQLARDMDDTLPNLPQPVFGADPLGFVWLTWERGERRFALGLKSNAFAWEQHTPEVRRLGESQTLGDVVDALRATFPRLI